MQQEPSRREQEEKSWRVFKAHPLTTIDANGGRWDARNGWRYARYEPNGTDDATDGEWWKWRTKKEPSVTKMEQGSSLLTIL